MCKVLFYQDFNIDFFGQRHILQGVLSTCIAIEHVKTPDLTHNNFFMFYGEIMYVYLPN